MKIRFSMSCRAALALLLLTSATARADHPTAGFGEGGGGPINTISATPFPAGRGSISLRLEYIDLDRFSDSSLRRFAARGEEVDSTDFVFSAFLSAAYGVTDNLTIGARIPYIFRDDIREPRLAMGVPDVEDEGDSAGHGDLLVFGQVRVLHLEEAGLELGVLAGLELPTGYTSDRSREGERFEVEHQPGSGSWDPLVGASLTQRWGRLSLHGNGLFTFATEGSQETNLGDLLNYNVAVVYRLGGPEGHEHGGPGGAGAHRHAPPGLAWDLIFEWNGEWREKIEIDGERDDDSGGHTIVASPGARMRVDGHLSVFASVGIPVFQDLNGNNHQTDFRVVAGVSLGF